MLQTAELYGFYYNYATFTFLPAGSNIVSQPGSALVRLDTPGTTKPITVE
jgi:hypothetical protein